MNSKFQLELRCLPVENGFLGKGITIAGLLAGSDIYASVQNQMFGDYLIIPSECMTGEKGLFLDDWVQKDLETRLQKPVFGGEITSLNSSNWFSLGGVFAEDNAS